MREGKWMLVAKGVEDSAKIGKLELYDIDTDRSQTVDLSGKYPDRTKKMHDQWLVWANRVKVFPLDSREYNQREKESRKREKSIWDKRKKN